MLKDDDEVNLEVPEDLSHPEYEHHHHHHEDTNRFNGKKEQNFNLEFDGIIQSEGVLEMMPDGYGFLRAVIIIICFPG